MLLIRLSGVGLRSSGTVSCKVDKQELRIQELGNKQRQLLYCKMKNHETHQIHGHLTYSSVNDSTNYYCVSDYVYKMYRMFRLKVAHCCVEVIFEMQNSSHLPHWLIQHIEILTQKMGGSNVKVKK